MTNCDGRLYSPLRKEVHDGDLNRGAKGLRNLCIIESLTMAFFEEDLFQAERWLRIKLAED